MEKIRELEKEIANDKAQYDNNVAHPTDTDQYRNALQKQYEKLQDKNKQLADLKKNHMVIVWDLETTGFVAPKAKILEIGCFIIRGGEIERKHWVLDNKCEIPEKITEITGITQEIIDEEGRDPAECLNEFLPLFRECDQNITHNGIKFDIPFLTDYAADVLGWDDKGKEAAKNTMRKTAYDTAVCVKAKKLNMERAEGETFVQFGDRVMRVFAKGVFFNLAVSLEEAGIELDLVAHRAMADVEMTYELYKKIHD